MSNSIPALFKTSLVAAAIVSLSACSTTPGKEDTGLSRVGAGILTAGRTTADVTGRAWDKTTYLLGFSDEDVEARADETQISEAELNETRAGGALSDEGLLMDAEEVTLLEDNGTLSRDTTIRPIVIHSATPNRRARDQIPTVTQRVETSQVAITESPASETPINDAVGELAQSDIIPESENTSELAVMQSEPMPAVEDMVHTVGSSETLWDIAKKTTGDATNWHILADINNLGPNASVYAGQKLTIPADMIKPSLTEIVALETSDQESVPEQIYVDTQNLSGVTSKQVVATAQPQLDAPAPVASDIEKSTQASARAFKLNPGETLWDFAKRTTGDATNWQAIAGQNEFSAEQAAVVRTGQTIYVPESLIKPDLESAIITAKPELETASKAQEELLETAITTVEAAPAEALTATAKNDTLRTLTISSKAGVTDETELPDANADLLSDSLASVKPDQPIKIVEANFQAEETTSLATPATDELKSVASDPQSPDQIMVSGTYYPKAIYNNADFSSSLLMRVSPGTTLQVAKSMGNWYQVKTSKGLGYVHQRDIK